MISWKVELKLKWTNHCVLSDTGADNDNANPFNIIFAIKDTKLYAHVFTLPAKEYKKLSKLLRKGFLRSEYCNDYKTKYESKNIPMCIGIFSNQTL